MASQWTLFSRTCSTSSFGSSRTFSTSCGVFAATNVRCRLLMNIVSLTSISINARRNHAHKGTQARLPFLSPRQDPGHNPQFTDNRNVPNGPPKSRTGLESAPSSRMLALFRALVKDDRETEAIFSVDRRRGLHLRGILSRQQDSAPRGSNVPQTLLAEIHKGE